MEEFIISLVRNPLRAYLSVFGVLLACGLGLPIPEDITLLAGGYTVHLAKTMNLPHPDLLVMMAVGMLGVLSGDTILFGIGRWAGPRVTTVWPLRLLFSEKRLAKVSAYFHKHGAWTAFFARFAAGLRAPIYLLAGSSQMKFRTFFVADFLAALISVPLLVWIAFIFGHQFDRVKHWIARGKVVIGLVVLTLLLVWIGKAIWQRCRRPAAIAVTSTASSSTSSPSSPVLSQQQDAE